MPSHNSGAEAIRSEDERLKTFTRAKIASTNPRLRARYRAWPHALPPASAMVLAGLVYRPTAHCDDNVVCIICGEELGQWRGITDVSKRHKHTSNTMNSEVVASTQKQCDRAYHQTKGSEESTEHETNLTAAMIIPRATTVLIPETQLEENHIEITETTNMTNYISNAEDTQVFEHPSKMFLSSDNITGHFARGDDMRNTTDYTEWIEKMQDNVGTCDTPEKSSRIDFDNEWTSSPSMRCSRGVPGEWSDCIHKERDKIVSRAESSNPPRIPILNPLSKLDGLTQVRLSHILSCPPLHRESDTYPGVAHTSNEIGDVEPAKTHEQGHSVTMEIHVQANHITAHIVRSTDELLGLLEQLVDRISHDTFYQLVEKAIWQHHEWLELACGALMEEGTKLERK